MYLGIFCSALFLAIVTGEFWWRRKHPRLKDEAGDGPKGW